MKNSNNFDNVAKVYDLSRGYSEEVGNQITKSFLDIITNNDKALEIGAGTGLFTQFVNNLFTHYVAFDISENMLEKLEANYNKDGRILSLVGDAAAVPFLSSYFDVVIMSKVIRHIGQWEKALSEIKRVLKSGGKFIHIEEKWLEVTEASQVRPKWKEILKSYGYEPNKHPGPTSNEPIIQSLQTLGIKEIKKVDIATWEVGSSPAQVINHLERGGGSSVFGIPSDVLQKSIDELRAWAEKKWDDIEKIEYKQKALEAIIVTV